MSLEKTTDASEMGLTPYPEIWTEGTLFHLTSRWPQKYESSRADRLVSILELGLISPGLDPQNPIAISDINITVEGSHIPYDSVVYLHRFALPHSIYYLPRHDDTLCFFVDSEIPVWEPKDMGYAWPIICQDEVYVPNQIPRERITGLAISIGAFDIVRSEYGESIAASNIPLYTFDLAGNIYHTQC